MSKDIAIILAEMFIDQIHVAIILQIAGADPEHRKICVWIGLIHDPRLGCSVIKLRERYLPLLVEIRLGQKCNVRFAVIVEIGKFKVQNARRGAHHVAAARYGLRRIAQVIDGDNLGSRVEGKPSLSPIEQRDATIKRIGLPRDEQVEVAVVVNIPQPDCFSAVMDLLRCDSARLPEAESAHAVVLVEQQGIRVQS